MLTARSPSGAAIERQDSPAFGNASSVIRAVRLTAMCRQGTASSQMGARDATTNLSIGSICTGAAAAVRTFGLVSRPRSLRKQLDRSSFHARRCCADASRATTPPRDSM